MMTVLEVIDAAKGDDVDILFVFGVAVAFLVTFDLLALRYGADSRQGIGDDRRRPLNPTWL